jgi:hypothetical protein
MGFIAHLRIITISNYNAIANSHILRFTTAHTSLLGLLCLRRLYYNGFLRRRFLSFRVSRLLSSLAGAYLTTRLGVVTQRLTTMSLRLPRLRQGRLSQQRDRVTVPLLLPA